MEGLLTPVSTSYKHAPKDVEPALVEVIKPRRQAKPSFQASTPIEALEILKNEPDYDSLISTLKFLRQDSPDFNIVSPSPAASQLIHILVHDIIPNYWGLLRDLPQRKDSQHPNSDLNLFLSCLRSVPGLNAVLLALKQRIQQARDTKKTAGGPKVQEILSVLLQVLQALLQGTETVKTIWKDIYTSPEPTVRDNAIWQEFLGLCGGGKLLGTSAEAEDVINDLSKKVQEKHWIADGSLFSLWLAKNTSYWALSLPADSKTGFASCASFLSKAFRLGHTGTPSPINLVMYQTIINV
jgi:telomere length regulation protein